MELGIIGLGKMGFNMAERLRLAGHKVVGFDFNKEATAKLTAAGSARGKLAGRSGEESFGAARDLDHGSVGRSGGPDDCTAGAVDGEGRHVHRWRQLEL